MSGAKSSIGSLQSASDGRRIGLILAAGRGRRMGQTKQLVGWRTTEGEKPLVAAAYDAIYCVCNEMIVVLGHEADAVAAALGERLFHRVSSDPDAEMFTSIRAGLAAAQQVDASAPVLLQPGDHPEVSPSTLQAIIQAAAQQAEMAIIPEHKGRRGHPVLIPASLIARLLAKGSPGGLARFWTDHPELSVQLAVDDERILFDVDTPEQLERNASSQHPSRGA